MRDELKSDIRRKIDRYTWRSMLNVLVISLITTLNIFFALFVWHPYDKSPNFAIGFISLIVIVGLVYSWNLDKKEIRLEIKKENKKE